MKRIETKTPLLAVPFVLALLASCGGGGGDDQGPPADQESSNWDEMVWDEDDWA